MNSDGDQTVVSFIKLENVTRSIPLKDKGCGERIILEKTNLSLEKGKMVSVCGPSGAGKTTLLGLVGLLWRPTSGRIMFKDEDITKKSPLFWNRLRRNGVGFCFQHFSLIRGLPAWENVAIPLIARGMNFSRRKDLARAVMSRLGLEEKWRQVTETLSGGEKQRLALARSLVSGTEVVVADEPISNVDRATAELVYRELDRSRADGIAILVSGMDFEWDGLADRRFRLEKGRLSFCDDIGDETEDGE